MPSESPRAPRYRAMSREALIDEVLKLDELIERMARQAGVYCWDWFPEDRRSVYYRPNDGDDDWGLRSQRTDFEYLEDVHPQDRDRVLEVYERPADYEVEYRVRNAQEGWTHIRETALTFYDDGDHWVRQEGTIQNITELKRAEHKLRQREAWLNHAQTTAKVGYWVWYGDNISDWSLEGTADGRLPLLSKQLREIFGIKDDQHGQPAWRVHPQDEDEARKALGSADESRHSYDIEYRVTDASGAIKVVHEVGEPSIDADSGQTVWIGVVQDITQQKETEEALRRSEDRFALAVRGSQGGIWDWDIERAEIYYSPRLLEITDFPPDQSRISAERVLPSIHPDDRERYKAALVAHLKGQTAFFECEMRVLTQGGAVRWILDRGLALRDAAGRAYRMAGSVIDVTQRREAEEALRDERNFNSTIFDTADALIVVLDRNGRIVKFNKKCEELSGYSFSEIEQRIFWEFLLTPEDAASAKDRYKGPDNR